MFALVVINSRYTPANALHYTRRRTAVKLCSCPFCHQPMWDLSNDPRFVNHNPDKIIEEKVNLPKKKESKDSKKRIMRPLGHIKERPCTNCKKQIPWHWHWCDHCGSPQ